MPQPFSTKVFICYRHEDAEAYADRLFDSLRDRFGEGVVFIDVDGIPPGKNFVKVMTEAVSLSALMIAVIGRHWLSSVDKQSRRRLDNPNDPVRLEIATALSHGIEIIPVLVQGATMPAPDELPEDLVNLADLNALDLTRRYWDKDVERLIARVTEVLDARRFDETAATTVSPEPNLFRRKATIWRAVIISLLILGLVSTGFALRNVIVNRRLALAANANSSPSPIQSPSPTTSAQDNSNNSNSGDIHRNSNIPVTLPTRPPVNCDKIRQRCSVWALDHKGDCPYKC